MNLIRMYLAKMEKPTLWFSAAFLLFLLIMLIAHAVLKKSGKSMRIFRALCFLPFLFCLLHFYLFMFKGKLSVSLQRYFPMYIGAFVMIIWQFSADRKKGYLRASILTVTASLFGFLMAVFAQTAGYDMVVVGNFSRQNYVECFEGIINEMKENYVLNDWKEINYNELQARFLPKVEKAKEEQDPVAFYKVLSEYISCFHDGHVCLAPFRSDRAYVVDEAMKEIAGNDFGFSLFTVESGETIAVMVDEKSDAGKLGIKNGTEIVKWNGVDIKTAIENAESFLCDAAPVQQNSELTRPIYFAGNSGKKLELVFLDETQKEITVTLNSRGDYLSRQQQTLSRLAASGGENFGSKMLTEDCGYLAINKERNALFKDIVAEINHKYPEITEQINTKLLEMKEQGMKSLVIDTRNNRGGYPIILLEIVRLFTNEKIDMGWDALKNGNIVKKMNHAEVVADGRWAELPVVVLTNMECASAGDGLVYALSQCKNVTTMGITTSEGVYQGTGGVCVTTNSEFTISYPVFASVEENGQPMIDVKADRVSRLPLDVTIPVTKEAALSIFSDSGTDYELNYAIKYLNRGMNDDKVNGGF